MDCSFEPERHLPPRSEGSDPFWNDYSVVFGAGDNTKGHSCAGELLLPKSTCFSISFTIGRTAGQGSPERLNVC